MRSYSTRISTTVLERVAAVLDSPKVEVYVDHTAIPREVRVYVGSLPCIYFKGSNSNRLAYDYLIENLRKEIEKES